MAFLRKPTRRGLRAGEELLLDVEVEAPAERHPEQLVWLLTAEPQSGGQ